METKNIAIVGILLVAAIVLIVLFSGRQDVIESQYFRHDCLAISTIEFNENSFSYDGLNCSFDKMSLQEGDSVNFISNTGGFEAVSILVGKSDSCIEIKKAVADKPGRENDDFYLSTVGDLYLCNRYY